MKNVLKRSQLVYNHSIGGQRYQCSVWLLIGRKNLDGMKYYDYSNRKITKKKQLKKFSASI